jgi:mono/diheme cytochrome c family protein
MMRSKGGVAWAGWVAIRLSIPSSFSLLIALALLLAGIGRADERDEMRLYMKGDYVYQRHCADCHGRKGRGDGPLAEGVALKPRDFRKGVFKFRSTPMGKLPTDADLARTIRQGVPGSLMPAFGKLRDEEVRAVLVYLKSMSRRWHDQTLQVEPLNIPEEPAWLQDEGMLSAHVDAGRARFAQHCASCHGENGRGDGVAAAALVDHWGQPIAPVDLTSPIRRSGPARADVFRTIAMGLDGTPMVGYLEPFGPEAIWEVVAFVESLVDE